MPIYDDLDDRASAANHLERCRRDFEKTGNPLFAWEAWSAWRSAGATREKLGLPAWLAAYLDDCGRKLFSTRAPRAREGPGSIGKALGFRHALGAARKSWGGPWDERERLALQAIETMWHEGLRLERAAKLLEKMDADGKVKIGLRTVRHTIYFPPHVAASRASITDAVRKSQRFAVRVMQDRLREATGAVPEREHLVRAYSDLCASRAR